MRPMTARRQILLSAGAFCAIVALPGRAFGQETKESEEVFLGAEHKRYESPQHFALELRFSAFTPDIDKDPLLAGRNPYETAFGTADHLLFGAEFDWQTARIPHVGTLGPGLGVSYVKMSRPAQFAVPQANPPAEDTTLEILPFYVVGVLRADAVWRELHVPLVPYAKLGLGLAFWRASNTLGTSHYGGVAGLGHTFGGQFAVGLGLNLNVFDPYAARNFDESAGVNNTYAYLEWTASDLTGLAQQDALRVGGNYWTFGLAFEF
jgi:hypothetical protein